MRKLLPALVLSVAMISGSAFAQESKHDQNSASSDDMSSETTASTSSSQDMAVSSSESQAEDQAMAASEYGTETEAVAQPESEVDQREAAGVAGTETMGTTTTEVSEVKRGMMMDEVVGIKPQLGVVGFTEPDTGDDTVRAAGGIGMEFNLSHMVAGGNRAVSPLRHSYIGISTGALYSHLGRSGADFFGYNTGPDAGSNLVIIPANLKLAYNFSDSVRIGAHGGGNVLYRSITNTINTGDQAAGGDDSWNFYPNAGLDLEFGLGRNVALLIRPDWTFTPADDIASGTLALSFPLS